jgi:hypothetical protein
VGTIEYVAYPQFIDLSQTEIIKNDRRFLAAHRKIAMIFTDVVTPTA